MTLLRDRSGAAAVEYALITGLVAVALISTLRGVQYALMNTFLHIYAQLSW